MNAKAFAKYALMIASTLTLSTALAAAPKNLENIELQWKATTDLKELSGASLGAITSSIAIPTLKDMRGIQPTNKIGENTEGKVVRPVTTKSDIPQFVTDNMKDILRKSGMTIAPDKGDYTLVGEITDFFISETKNYNGSMTLKLTLMKADKPIWKGSITGTNKRFGRSYRQETYLEALSDLIVDVTTKLGTSHEFKSQLN